MRYAIRRSATLALIGLLSTVPALAASQADTTLGTVRIPVAVKADGQPLAPGTYTLRVSSQPVTPVVGQSADSEKWVEFVQAGVVKGKELASVVAPADVKAVAKRTPPPAGRPVVHTLRGNDYLRVWVNKDGSQYLVHLTR